MAKIFGNNVPHLVAKQTAGGQRFYWQPAPRLKDAGWRAMSLGSDMLAAIAAAKAQNDKVDGWRHGGAKPKAVKVFNQRATVAALIEAYKKDESYTGLALNTQRTYSSALNLIEAWATNKKSGDLAAASITPERVKVLRNALMRPNAAGVSQHHRAHNTLRVLRTLFAFGLKARLVEQNPANTFDLATPAPRDQIWDHADVAAFSAAAIRIGYPGLSFAVELAEYIAQREEDMLKLQSSQWREVHNLDPELQHRLAGPDGKVMGLFIRQGKTKRWVGIPIAGTMREKIETAIADNAARPVPATTILVDDETGRAWTIRQFIRKFVDAKMRAVEPTAKDVAGGVLAHPELRDLQFRDLRRTCVVRLGELGLEDQLISAITGHKLETVKKILEVYMPRTTKMAARAVVARIGPAARPTDAGAKQA